MKTPPSELPLDLASLGFPALEEWFLTHLEDTVLPFEKLDAILAFFRERGHTERAETCADLIHDVLAQRRDEERLLALWEWRATWHADDPSFSNVCAARLSAVFRGQSRMETFIRNAGFDRNLPATESLRRLRVLRGLKPGTLCWETTWGLGTVIDIAEFDQQVRIDFENKKAHRMSLAYAAERLTVLPDDHLLVRNRRDAAGFSEWVRKYPAAVVTSALHSFGPLSAPALQKLLAGRIFPETDWKGFWDAARKQLKSDPLVEFPARRNDPIRLLKREKQYDSAWLAELASERNFGVILEHIESWNNAEGSSAVGAVPPAIQDRLDFIIQSADPSKWPQRAHALILTGETGVFDTLHDAPEQMAALSDPETMTTLFHRLPVSLMRRLLLFLEQRNRTHTEDLLFQILADLPLAPFNEAATMLRKQGAELRFIDTLRSLAAAGKATPEMVFWLCRHADFACRHGICSMGQLAIEALTCAENDALSGERLKARHQIRSLLEQTDWLAGALDAMQDLDRRQLISRLKKSPAWSNVERHALIYRLTQPFPELQDCLAEDTPTPAAPPRRLTSHRSYRERQAQLHKIITEDIPQNSRDIATARDYGDLRENFEYKSAHEAQGILMRRHLELESMLSSMTSTDFEGFQSVIAGIGTCVTLAHGDGTREHFAILGEWDHDERLGIISSKSKLAEALIGHKPGDPVSIPAENGSATVTLVTVSGLTDEIRAWLNDD